jgi:hypothetical protein
VAKLSGCFWFYINQPDGLPDVQPDYRISPVALIFFRS